MTFKKVGGIILRLGERIITTSVYNGFSGGATLPPEVRADCERLEENYKLIDRTQQENRRLLASMQRRMETGNARVLTRKPRPGDKKE